jgi:uncharacterized protein (TIGR00375 family)
MPFIADLHLHSGYSRATSREMVPEGIWKWAQLKGIALVGTGDFTHPGWFREIREKLEPLGNGLFRLKGSLGDQGGVPVSCLSEVSFLLSAEISCIYRKNGRTRKVHCLVFMPDLERAALFNLALGRIGNITSDGRPILGLDAKELLKITLDIAPEAVFVPAHVWTPHFSVLGAASGFDSMEECFEELTPHIFAVETGLSSDPPMNWRVSALDGFTLISNSDAHSPAKMGREANIFDTDISYDAVMKAIKKREGFLGTIEFFPEEGKYHYDGHRACNVSYSPRETIAHGYSCPGCGKRLTIGVAHRVEALSDRGAGFKPPQAPLYHSLIPLPEILAEARGTGVNTKGVQEEYMGLLAALGSEFKILLDASLSDIDGAASPLVAEGIKRVRQGRVDIAPGYDGEYGRVTIFDKRERAEARGQGRLL